MKKYLLILFALIPFQGVAQQYLDSFNLVQDQGSYFYVIEGQDTLSRHSTQRKAVESAYLVARSAQGAPIRIERNQRINVNYSYAPVDSYPEEKDTVIYNYIHRDSIIYHYKDSTITKKPLIDSTSWTHYQPAGDSTYQIITNVSTSASAVRFSYQGIDKRWPASFVYNMDPADSSHTYRDTLTTDYNDAVLYIDISARDNGYRQDTTLVVPVSTIFGLNKPEPVDSVKKKYGDMAFLEIPIAQTISGTLSDFAVYVKPSAINGWSSITLAQAQSLRFYSDSAKTNELAREIVSADEIWVKTDLSNGDNIYADYDGVRSDYADTATYGSQAVWAGYNAAYHMGEANIIDATGNGNTGVNNGSTSGSGKIGPDRTFNGSSDFITVSNIVNLSSLSNFTLSAWAKITGKNADSDIIGQNSSAAVELRYDKGNDTWLFNVSDGSYHYGIFSQATTTTNTWYHIVGVFDSGTLKIYVNGQEGTTTGTSGNLSYTDSKIYIGALASSQRLFNGGIDEVRILPAARSSAYIAAEYANQNDPASFFGTASAVSSGTNAEVSLQDKKGGFSASGTIETQGSAAIQDAPEDSSGSGDVSISADSGLQDQKETINTTAEITNALQAAATDNKESFSGNVELYLNANGSLNDSRQQVSLSGDLLLSLASIAADSPENMNMIGKVILSLSSQLSDNPIKLNAIGSLTNALQMQIHLDDAKEDMKATGQNNIGAGILMADSKNSIAISSSLLLSMAETIKDQPESMQATSKVLLALATGLADSPESINIFGSLTNALQMQVQLTDASENFEATAKNKIEAYTNLTDKKSAITGSGSPYLSADMNIKDRKPSLAIDSELLLTLSSAIKDKKMSASFAGNLLLDMAANLKDSPEKFTARQTVISPEVILRIEGTRVDNEITLTGTRLEAATITGDRVPNILKITA